MRYTLGLDFGSGGCKATLIDEHTYIAATAYRPYPNHYERPLWVEQDPQDWVSAGIQATTEVLQRSHGKYIDAIDAIAFSAPHHIAVLLDKDDQVIRRAIMWADQRSSAQCEELRMRSDSLIWSETNNEVSPTWTLPQLLWIRQNEPEAYSRIHRIMLMKDYVRYRFTGHVATDYVDAGGTLFYNIHHRRWSEPLLAELGLRPDQLPEIKEPTSPAGAINRATAQLTGLREGTPVFVGTADTAAELLGAGALREGDRVAKLATAGNNAMIATELPSREKRMLTYDYVLESHYYLNQATNFAAASFRWFRETFLDSRKGYTSTENLYEQVNQEISTLSAGSDGLLFHPYLVGERAPHWDPMLRGSFVGITTRHTINHFARAVMEGISYSLRDAATAHTELDPSVPLLLIGGGAKSSVWSQLFSEVFNSSVHVPINVDSSFGTALIAATAAGWFPNIQDARVNAQITTREHLPDPGNAAYYDDAFRTYQEVTRLLTKVNHELSSLHP